MSRHIAREIAFKILFQTDVGRNPWQEVLPRTLQENDLPEKSRQFLEQLVKGTIRNLKMIDDVIIKYAQDWKLDRMANTDRNILRMAIYELKFLPDIPAGVTVNEAVELAKRYGDEESGRFVNGILGNVARATEGKNELEKAETIMED
ncbi:MAG: transcription antitermination factor NusB [Bacillota bacterium]